MSAEEVRRGMRELGVRKDSNKAAEGMFNFNYFPTLVNQFQCN
jgi:hypothetical protein